MQIMAYRKPDGTVAVVHPAPKENIEQILGPLTDEEYWDHVKSVSIPDTIDNNDIITLDDSELPQSRYFRDAWMMNGQAISVDIVKARENKLAKLSFMAEEKVKQKDAEYLKAIDTNDILMQQSIIAEKNQLRGLSSSLDLSNINDVNELENFIPPILE